MVRKDESHAPAKSKSKESSKSAKDAGKKVSVSTLLSNMDKPPPAAAAKPRAKPPPAEALAYTSGINLPPSDDEEEVFLLHSVDFWSF